MLTAYIYKCRDNLQGTATAVAVGLFRKGDGGSLQTFKKRREVMFMSSIDTVIAVITLGITAAGFGLQLASYINTKVDRPSDKD